MRLDDVLNSALRYFDIQHNLFCAYALAAMAKDAADHCQVQLHILEYVFNSSLDGGETISGRRSYLHEHERLINERIR